MDPKAPISTAQGAAALVANLTTNGNLLLTLLAINTNQSLGDIQQSVVSSGTLSHLIALLSLKDTTIARSAVCAFGNVGKYSIWHSVALFLIRLIARNPSIGSKILMSNDMMGAILKRLESEEDETILLPFAKALHHFALQGILFS